MTPTATDSMISLTFDAKTTPGKLPRRYVVVDRRFAEKLRTEHSRTFEARGEGRRRITRDVPLATDEMLAALDGRGVVVVGTTVKPGSYLVGMVEPRAGTQITAEQRLLAAIFQGPDAWVDVSVLAPPGCFGTVRAVEMPDEVTARVTVGWERPLEVGDVLRLGAEEAVVIGIEELEGADIRWGSRDGLVVPVTKTAMARDTMSARSAGPHDAMLFRPLEAPDTLRGQRIGPSQAEVLADHAPWALWELYTLKSDAKSAAERAFAALAQASNPGASYGPPDEPSDGFSFFAVPPVPHGEVRCELPETLVVLSRYLMALGLEVNFRAQDVGVRPLAPDVARWSHGAVEHGDFGSQRVFGPLKDFTCACGALSGYRNFGCTCVECGVDILRSDVRRKRFGHLELAIPCRHPVLGDEGPPLKVLPVLPPAIRFDGIDDLYARVWTARRSADELQVAVDELAAALLEAAEWLWQEAFSKPVDFSGVAHLVADPSVEPGSCRLPISMAMELFRPFAFAILQDRGYASTLQAARMMVDREGPAAVAAIHQACVGRPLLLAAGPNIVARSAEIWDAAAIAVDPATAGLLAAQSVVVHVPLSHQAALECSDLPDCPQVVPGKLSGWLAAARTSPRFMEAVRRATLEGTVDAVEDSLLAAGLGRPPAMPEKFALRRWAELDEERQGKVGGSGGVA